MILSNPDPVPAEVMSLVHRSANAWEGGYGAPDPTSFDPELWRQGTSSSWVDGDARVLVNVDGSDLAVVDQKASGQLFSTRSDSNVEDDYDGDLAARKYSYTFVSWPTENFEFMALMDQPPVDGYLVLQAVLAENDRIVPVKAEWRGRCLSREEAEQKLKHVVGLVETIAVKTKVPAPVLPNDVEGWIVRAREGLTRTEREEFVDVLLSLEPSQFLEAIDRMLPWMKGPLERAKLAWMDKESSLADKAWSIASKDKKLSESMRLAPWKSAIGNPTQLDLRMKFRACNGQRQWIDIPRRPNGRYAT